MTPDSSQASKSGQVPDVEAQGPPSPVQDRPETEQDGIDSFQDNSNVPQMSLIKLFWFFFYNFGLFAWGGPVAQIALIKDKLVIQDKWITLPRFQRVFSVYQILPGPEAAELCMVFGCLSAGRIGGIVAGIAFILPGFILMLLASYLYSLAGFENKYFNASFRAVQPIVSAMILRATHKIADHCVINHATHKVNHWLVIAGLCTALNSALRINIFISLGLYGIIYSFIARRKWIISGILFVLQYVAYAVYVVFRGVPSPVSLALGIAKTPSLPNLLVLGLVAGTLSFGGAYTAIPFIQVEAVLKGGWLPAHVFLDCIAIGNVLPAPLVIFATFVGFHGGLKDGLGNAFAGAVIITLGMFAPCFIFTIAGHELLEKLVRNKKIEITSYFQTFSTDCVELSSE
ncbi:putative chromate ion transporter [Aspergillus mulundensis]|uniref:Putative Chromate transporter n=1 Tax=Aspergillus mulundensis TaxID=1810919 RepID=A0A3D8QP67_9EURO|nr:putative Chromate transporter [Aspergillus mulundensis]RDW63244.1 putative Chromate transporter [Aspergillus mulundensis]